MKGGYGGGIMLKDAINKIFGIKKFTLINMLPIYGWLIFCPLLIFHLVYFNELLVFISGVIALVAFVFLYRILYRWNRKL
jgi:hypothetical protein